MSRPDREREPNGRTPEKLLTEVRTQITTTQEFSQPLMRFADSVQKEGFHMNLSKMAAEQLLHFRFGPIWDGNLNSKTARDELVDAGLLERAAGFQFLTAKAVKFLSDSRALTESTWSEKRPFKG